MSLQDVAARNPFNLEQHCSDWPDACFNCHRCTAWADFWNLIRHQLALQAERNWLATGDYRRAPDV